MGAREIVLQVGHLPWMRPIQIISVGSHIVPQLVQEWFLCADPGVTTEYHWVWCKEEKIDVLKYQINSNSNVMYVCQNIWISTKIICLSYNSNYNFSLFYFIYYLTCFSQYYFKYKSLKQCYMDYALDKD